MKQSHDISEVLAALYLYELHGSNTRPIFALFVSKEPRHDLAFQFDKTGRFRALVLPLCLVKIQHVDDL